MPGQALFHARQFDVRGRIVEDVILAREPLEQRADRRRADMLAARRERLAIRLAVEEQMALIPLQDRFADLLRARRSEEHTSELQSLMRISYAVFCLKKKKEKKKHRKKIIIEHIRTLCNVNQIQFKQKIRKQSKTQENIE